MPNHITNLLTFSGKTKDIEKLRKAIRPDTDSETAEEAEEGGQIIDFNKIIPMPKSLNITSGTTADYGLAVYLFQKQKNASKLLEILSYPWAKSEGITTPEAMAKYLIDKGSANLEEGEKAFDNQIMYGHKDWYSWAVDKWGTKWNAYSQSEDGLEKIAFDTAWSTPEPVIRKLSEMFPTVIITLRYADEDFGHNCGELTFLKGHMIDHNIPDGASMEAYIIASDVKGCELEDFVDRFAETDEENSAATFIEVMFNKFPKDEVVEAIINHEHTSLIFLITLKKELLSLECYELVGQVESSIKEKENK